MWWCSSLPTPCAPDAQRNGHGQHSPVSGGAAMMFTGNSVVVTRGDTLSSIAYRGEAGAACLPMAML
jgi:hypothetical protein